MATIKTMASTAKKGAKLISLAAMTTAMCVNMGLSDEESAAAQAAMRDIAKDKGAGVAKAIIVHMDPFDGFVA